MAKLCQIIAVVNGKKTKTQKELTETYKKLQKPALFEGITRTYHKTQEDGEDFPPERKNVQYTAKQALQETEKLLSDFIDSTATMDFANCTAKADVVVGGQIILPNVPVTHLLFLEKQLVDLRTFVNTLPVLDPAEKWTFSKDTDCYVSDSFRTNKTQKVPRSHVMYHATDKHPAQVQMYQEDVKVGEWETIKFSGALPAQERNAMVEKIDALSEAVKCAREEANSKEEVENIQIAKKVFGFILGGK